MFYKIINYTVSLLIALMLICCSNTVLVVPSLKTSAPIIIRKDGAEIFQYWDLKNNSELWDTNFAKPANLQLYIDSLKITLSKDILNQTIQRVAFQNKAFKWINTQNGDSVNAQLVHSDSLGEIRPINYLEAQLLDYQLSRYPLLAHPTEFHGFILINDSLGLVRCYFAASDQPWPPRPNDILKAIETDLKYGWAFKYHLHNHYEPKANKYLGILAPSLADAQFYMFLSEEYHLMNALITNGFHTVEIPSNEFPKFKSHGNNGE